MPLFGLTLLVDLSSAVAFGVFSDTHGVATLPISIPNDMALVGSAFYFQALGAEPCAAPAIGATNGLSVVVR